MQSNTTDTIAKIVLGSVLGFLATLVSAQISSWVSLRRRRQSFASQVRLALAATKAAIEELKVAYDHQRFYDFLILDLIDRNIDELYELRRQSHLIKNDNFREKVYKLTSRVAFLARDMRGTQNYAYRSTQTDNDTGAERPMTKEELGLRDKLIDDRRTAQMMEIVEVKSELAGVVEQLDN